MTDDRPETICLHCSRWSDDPETCSRCGGKALLSWGERLDCHYCGERIDYASWREFTADLQRLAAHPSDDPADGRSSSLAEATVFLTCDSCRDSIEENAIELELDSRSRGWTEQVSRGVALFAIAAVVLIFVAFYLWA